MTERAHLRGVTLIELVIVMTLLGILAAVAAVALTDPIKAYGDSIKRAELTDLTDASLRRVGRDIRRALPNSPRVSQSGNIFYLELLLTRTGGRYRAQGPGNALDFSSADTQFDSIGPLSQIPDQVPQVNDILVVHNLFSSASAEANAYTYAQAGYGCAAVTYATTCNSARITSVTQGAGFTTLTFASRQFPLTSPGNRFSVVEGPVTYICSGGGVDSNGDGVGALRRVSGYPVAFVQPTAFGNNPALLADHVSNCQIDYDPLVLNQSLGLVTLRLELSRGGETVRIYHEVHVSNIP